MTTPALRVFSWGGGVQSSAYAVLAIEGKVARPDAWVFADTGDEPRAVMRNVWRFGGLLAQAGMTLHIVRHPEAPLSEAFLGRVEQGLDSNNPIPPLWVPREQPGRTGRTPLNRRCTLMFKVYLLDRWSRARAQVPRGYTGPPLVESWVGFSRDEVIRIKPSKDPWRTVRHPLVDLGLHRSDCERILTQRGLPAIRSACVYCPFHSDAEWLRVREDPDDWARVLDFQRRLDAAWTEHGSFLGLRNHPTLHASGDPIDDVVFDASRQESLWGNECDGVCGV